MKLNNFHCKDDISHNANVTDRNGACIDPRLSRFVIVFVHDTIMQKVFSFIHF
jgi:hypothetical protein